MLSRVPKRRLRCSIFNRTLVLWNLSLKNKNIVSVQYKKQFKMIAKSPKKGDFAMLLGVWDEVGTVISKNCV